MKASKQPALWLYLGGVTQADLALKMQGAVYPEKVGPATRETSQMQGFPKLIPVSFLPGFLKLRPQKDSGGLSPFAHSGQTFITLKDQ